MPWSYQFSCLCLADKFGAHDVCNAHLSLSYVTHLLLYHMFLSLAWIPESFSYLLFVSYHSISNNFCGILLMSFNKFIAYQKIYIKQLLAILFVRWRMHLMVDLYGYDLVLYLIHSCVHWIVLCKHYSAHTLVQFTSHRLAHMVPT